MTFTSVPDAFRGRTILVTGAGGSIGSALSAAILDAAPHLLLLFDHSEAALYEVNRKLASGLPSRTKAILGDVLDAALLEEVFARHRPDVIFHTAAFKHVPLMEENALAAIRNNAVATWELARTARRHETALFLMVSSDKAVKPRSIMGASKRIAELALLELATAKTRMSAIRLGNVLDSQGSVAPLFREQIQDGGPVTVSHAQACRYFLSMDQAVQLILAAARLEAAAAFQDAARDGQESGIFVPQTGKPVKILDLARRMIQETKDAKSSEIHIAISGMRPGDKLSEEFVFANETLEPTAGGVLFRVRNKSILPVAQSMQALQSSLQDRDLATALETVRKLVPEYLPGETLLASANSTPPANRP